MAARWIPDPKVGGSNPSSLMFSQDVGDWSSGMILRLGRRGREFDSPITPLPFWPAAGVPSRASLRTSGLVGSHLNALLAQMVERKTFNLVVAGSIPAEGVFYCRCSIVVIAPAS